MGKYFGTDGIRGIANESLTLEIATRVGEYLGHLHQGERLVIGQDTRLSGSMFASALAAGATSMGADVYLLGVCATPALAFMITDQKFAGGIMISASHNPYYDNGLKCFADTGMKLDPEIEQDIEAYIDGQLTLKKAQVDTLGQVYNYETGLDIYKNHLQTIIKERFTGHRIVLDCANGSAISSAEALFKALGAEVSVIHNEPNGLNINRDCGSTHPESLQQAVLSEKAECGFAFDGDADRCLAVDAQGNLLDGDMILYILGKRFKEEGRLKENTVVTTVMANLGFIKAAHHAGLQLVSTAVGDKYVFSEMFKHDYDLGGEQSGHIILKDYATTGDGVLTALMLLETCVLKNATLETLASEWHRYPQALRNIEVKDKEKVMNTAVLTTAITNIEQELGDEGRILVRPSGTEPLIRVMVEAKTDALCEKYVNDMIRVIENIE